MEIKIFKKERSFKKRNSELNPQLYWNLLVYLTLGSVLISALLGYRLFKEINRELPVSPQFDHSKSDLIKKERINKVLLYFSEREEKSNEIRNSPAPIIDPSL